MSYYLGAAKVLEDLILDLREKGVDIPGHVVDSLKAGRSYASIWQRDTQDSETAMKAQSALEIVEMNLLSLAEEAVGGEYADGWQRKVAAAYQEAPEAHEKKPTFVVGVPKGDHWIRFETKDLYEIEGVERRLGERHLTARKQDDGFTLIHGKKEDVTAFMGEIREEYRQKNRRVGV